MELFSRTTVLSLFGRRSAIGVAGRLAIIDPLLIFHLFCLVFLTPGFNPLSNLLCIYPTVPPHVFVRDCFLFDVCTC
jgi:hypothetical protein